MMASRFVSILSTRFTTRATVWRSTFARRYSSTDESKPPSEGLNMRRQIYPSNFEKRVLVWTKVYNSEADIPAQISVSQMNYAKDRFRARMMVPMILVTMVGFYGMILFGRRLRDSGDSLALRGTEQVARWQAKEQFRREKEAAQQDKSVK